MCIVYRYNSCIYCRVISIIMMLKWSPQVCVWVCMDKHVYMPLTCQPRDVLFRVCAVSMLKWRYSAMIQCSRRQEPFSDGSDLERNELVLNMDRWCASSSSVSDACLKSCFTSSFKRPCTTTLPQKHISFVDAARESCLFSR